jgi:ABC-type antimicrobial peptide transport system permease subunit
MQVLGLFGLLAGVVGAVLVGRAMQSTLYAVQAFDFTVVGAVGAILFVTAMAASYLPARRAASIDPVKALRME